MENYSIENLQAMAKQRNIENYLSFSKKQLINILKYVDQIETFHFGNKKAKQFIKHVKKPYFETKRRKKNQKHLNNTSKYIERIKEALKDKDEKETIRRITIVSKRIGNRLKHINLDEKNRQPGLFGLFSKLQSSKISYEEKLKIFFIFMTLAINQLITEGNHPLTDRYKRQGFREDPFIKENQKFLKENLEFFEKGDWRYVNKKGFR